MLTLVRRFLAEPGNYFVAMSLALLAMAIGFTILLRGGPEHTVASVVACSIGFVIFIAVTCLTTVTLRNNVERVEAIDAVVTYLGGEKRMRLILARLARKMVHDRTVDYDDARTSFGKFVSLVFHRLGFQALPLEPERYLREHSQAASL